MKRVLYSYVGPDNIRIASESAPAGTIIKTMDDLRAWREDQRTNLEADQSLIATFVIDRDDQFRVAPRRSEHVACASGGPVYSAGEMAFSPDLDIIEISNQSTGFCPQPESWRSVASTIDKIPILRPEFFTLIITFRLCLNCGQRNIVKDEWFVCGVCQHDLSKHWNFAEPDSV